jgi:hypothetical protein
MRQGVIALSIAFGAMHVAAAAAVPAGISGTWYNPAQNGHGVSIEVLDDARALAFWYVYDPNGQPVHLYVDGRIDGRTIRGTAYRASGMRFGQFDPATLNLDIWGQIDLDVLSCQSLRMRYHGNGPAGAGYGSGEIALARLSQLQGLPCDPAPLVTGRYVGQFAPAPNGADATLLAAVDEDGRLWATSTYLLGPRYVSANPAPPVLVGAPISDFALVEVLALGNTGLDDEGAPGFPYLRSSHLLATVDASAAPRIVASDAQGTWLRSIDLTRDAAASARTLQPVPLAALAELEYRFTTLDQFVNSAYVLNIDAAGAVCLSTPGDSRCAWYGTLSLRNAQSAFFDFDLRPSTLLGQQFSERPPLVGRGWVERTVDDQIGALVFVGRDSRNGLGFIAQVQRQP